MHIVVLVLILIACILIILTVLAQNPKSGMAANFGASNQVMGVRQTTDFLEKFTWGLAVSIVFLCLAATMLMPRGNIAASRNAVEQSIIDATMHTPTNEELSLPFGGVELPQN
ncbi:MAG: preprotein translocase subunit SecG [Rikenellaceae bacterium]|nr:preprotein translocase subunit SecG [Rikenellaceae bacterium]MCL2692811.1 preprotein translocase subunit SecG [Rikenellaceae bacterium]